MTEYQAIVPAAGVGTRLKPHTHTLPKALIGVAGKPILGHILDDIARAGIHKVTVVTGFFAEKVEGYVRAEYGGLNLTFAHQAEQLGLGHAVWTALRERRDLPSLVLLGDTIVEADLAALLDQPDNAIAVAPTDDPRRFGIVELSGDRIVSMVEKPADPPSNLAIVGLYLIRDSEALYDALGGNIEAGVRTKGEFQLTDALARMLEGGTVFCPWEISGWYDCGKPETLLATNRVLLERDPPPVPAFPDSVVIAPSHIGRGVELTGSVVGPYAAVGAGAVIEGSIVRDSIIGAGARLANVHLDGSLIGENAVIQGRFDRLNLGDDSEASFT
ncbi:MAG TPA: nucleotidyl transferase [Candidatus Coatesbacteria bacterium]|nr:nucleotidyl transferase [Candidatus Coatesbacteria bacterium]